MDEFQALQQRLLDFAKVRDWEQFHSPKNLVMAMNGECGELISHFQWLTEAESHDLSAEKLAEVRFEMADVQIYLMRMAEVLGVDLMAAANEKTDINENRFPVDKVKGAQKRAKEY
ncbi:MAG: nucleotide pyrophosphohydrolase [Methylococcales bacterium]|jgi:dCTP diphosphatase|nr:nucleotide pyrophosphohydrolase [Methylococcales bacterium]MBT7443124.1 nucleotide pyrophosphohydrolase [Methylococcales bacterium]